MRHNSIRIVSFFFITAFLIGFSSPAFSKETEATEPKPQSAIAGESTAEAGHETSATENAPATATEIPSEPENAATEEDAVPKPLKSIEIDGKTYHYYGMDVEIRKKMHDVYQTDDEEVVYIDPETGKPATI